MRSKNSRAMSPAAIRMGLCTTGLLILTSCVSIQYVPPPPVKAGVDLAAFRKMAGTTSWCADRRNRLFLIDEQLVFWDRVGSCFDMAYSRVLYDGSPDRVLCSASDSYRGARRDCKDEAYRGVFDTIVAHLDDPDLGLGASHTVQAVPIDEGD